MALPTSQIDRSWTLFLDRDGVINRHLPNDYVRSIDQFKLLPGVARALAQLTPRFGRILIVTNQQGVGKGLYTLDDLASIHDHMVALIEGEGGRIDRVYVAPQLEAENSPMRKPGIGMAQRAKADFPEVDFAKSIMVGDTVGDMIFGRRAGMYTVLVGGADQTLFDSGQVDAVFPSLVEVAEEILEG